MANKSVFASLMGKLLPRTDAVNEAGAPAYALTPAAALAQLAATGTFNATFYADAEEQLSQILTLAAEVDPAFIAKTAIYARRQGRMKDMPALLTALLSTLETPHLPVAFREVVNNGRMLRTFVQIMRSGAVGRKSLGSRPKRLIQEWLEQASDRDLLRASVGQDPSLADIVKMVHPRPASPERAALYAWLIGRPYDAAALPQVVKDFEAFKVDKTLPVPDVPFQMLTSLDLSAEQWADVGLRAGWQMLRMNLNTFLRHGAFGVPGFATAVAKRLADPNEISKSGVLPYQLMVAYANAEVPLAVREALQDAMEVAVANVPVLKGKVVLCPDVSGSMGSSVTGFRQGATSKVRCIDVAGLMTAALLRANRDARVLPFERDVVEIDLNPRDTVMTNAAKLAAIGGGGTNCSAPVARLVDERADVDLVVFISDNESWMDARRGDRGTELMKQWQALKRINPDARMICLDIQPYSTSQAAEREDILNIGGFSDAVFSLIGQFADGTLGSDHWVGEIEQVQL
jgi:60 kDa SS-A/Ro ribonucleoprotein